MDLRGSKKTKDKKDKEKKKRKIKRKNAKFKVRELYVDSLAKRRPTLIMNQNLAN